MVLKAFLSMVKKNPRQKYLYWGKIKGEVLLLPLPIRATHQARRRGHTSLIRQLFFHLRDF